jgi:hypothetical protein
MNSLCWLVAVWLGSLLHAVDRSDPQGVAELRSQGPPALERLLARFDALPSGVEKDALELTIDAVAAQRYATVSRLYWYTDLEKAEAAARASGKPILSLRMLGRLDEDLSCANSRLFRIVLYADEDLSAFLRENFVLHWSSERPVPRVTIDFGDGRKIETTVTGNSAHYVLDVDGRPLDVLPGLYSAVAFRRELEAVLPLARESAGLSDAARMQRLSAYHTSRPLASAQTWAASGAPVRIALTPRVGVVEAETRTVNKAAGETPLVLGAGLGSVPIDSLVRTSRAHELWVRRLEEARLGSAACALIARLEPMDWGSPPAPVRGEALDERIQALEAMVAADTELNEVSLHARVHRWFASMQGRGAPSFAELNERVYRELFLTPAADAWLGLSSTGVITGLPRDGIVR